MARKSSNFKRRIIGIFKIIIGFIIGGCAFMLNIHNCKDTNDLYANYAQLKKFEVKNRDYKIDYGIKKDSKIAFFAIHGGRIELFTDKIARDLADDKYSYYRFIGIKKSNNYILHITSTCFDEPAALKVAKASETIVSIHGCKSDKAIIHVGGLNIKLAQLIKNKLISYGFQIGDCDNEEISGNNPNNICNKCKSGAGVQLEISSKLRNLFEKENGKNGIYKRFLMAINDAVKFYLKN